MGDHWVKIGVFSNILIVEFEYSLLDFVQRGVAYGRSCPAFHLKLHLNEVTGRFRKQDDANQTAVH